MHIKQKAYPAWFIRGVVASDCGTFNLHRKRISDWNPVSPSIGRHGANRALECTREIRTPWRDLHSFFFVSEDRKEESWPSLSRAKSIAIW